MSEEKTYIHDEPIGINHLRRFCSAAITVRQRFGVIYPSKNTAQVVGPLDEQANIVAIIESTRKAE